VPVVSKRASDLLNAHVGDSEKAIARAFEEARDEGALLILDEVDSLLSDRRLAVRSWEVSQVNELLVQLEAHTLPVVATTNFMERLDPACLRRFTFKIRLAEPAAPAFEEVSLRTVMPVDRILGGIPSRAPQAAARASDCLIASPLLRRRSAAGTMVGSMIKYPKSGLSDIAS